MIKTAEKILLSWLRAAGEVPGVLPPYPLYFARGMLHIPEEDEEPGTVYVCPCCKTITYAAFVGWELPHDRRDKKEEPLLQCQTAECGTNFFPPPESSLGREIPG